MLIYSLDRLVPTDVNMMVIRGKNNIGFYYIHRALYDQAVIINDIYGEDKALLIKAITGEEESREDVERFMTEVPSPINIFGPYLLLIKEELTELTDMIGAIHVMSGPMNLRMMLKVPIEIRNTPTFSLSIREEYQVAWDRFLMTTMPYSMDMWHPNTINPMGGTQTEVIPTGDMKTPEQEMEDLESVLFECGDDFFDMEEEEEAAVMAEIEANSAAVQQANSPENKVEEVQPKLIDIAPEPEPEPAPVELTGLEALIGGQI